MIPVKDRLLHTHTPSSVSALISCLPHFVCQGHCTIYWGPESISTTLWACTDEWFTPSKYLYQINSSNSQKRNTTSMRRLWMDDLKNDVKKDVAAPCVYTTIPGKANDVPLGPGGSDLLFATLAEAEANCDTQYNMWW